MNAKRKSTLGTRGNIEAPTRTANILNLLPEFDSDDGKITQTGSRNQNVIQRNSKCKQPRTNSVSTKTTSSRGSAKERPVNRVLYKRTALKPANSVAVHKEIPPRPESIKKLMAKSKLEKNNEETSVLTKGLEKMKERTARAHAARIVFAPNGTNVMRRDEIMGNGTPKMLLCTPLAQLTPQNLLFTKHKNDFPCSADQNDVPKRHCKSTAFELLSRDTLSSQSKQKIFVDENRMDQASTNVTERHFGNENQETLVHEYQKPGTMSCNLTADGLQKENTTHFFPNLQISSAFQNSKPLFLQTNISQNFTSAYNSNVATSQSKPNSPRLNHILPLPFGHLKTPISFADMKSSVKLQTSELKPLNISYSSCNTENNINVPSETNSALQMDSNGEINIGSNEEDKVDKVTNGAQAATSKEGNGMVQGGAYSLDKLQIMEILENMLHLQEECKAEMEYFMEKMKAKQNQHFEMLQKLLTAYRATEERDECKQSTSITREYKASFPTDMNTEMESEEILGLIIPASGKKIRRSARIEAKMNSNNCSSACTPDTCDKYTAVVSKYTDLQKSFSFLRTPRNCKTPLQSKTPTRTPRTIVSTSIREQLQLLYDTDSP